MIPAEATDRLNPLFAAALIQACIDCRVDHFFIAPGSRCTPLTLAVASQPHAKVVQHFDERGLAFACLGFGRAQQMAATADKPARPGAFICTSGTAVANAFPAVVEAAMDHVPMLLLTADRPPELIGIGANQAISQDMIFGSYPTFFENVSCPQSNECIGRAKQLVSRACMSAAAGPAHLNLQFREPFGVATKPIVSEPASKVQPSRPEQNVTQLPDGDTIIIVGGCSNVERHAAVELANRISAVLLGDITSGIRKRTYDLALMRNDLPAPKNVIHLGGRIVSKRWIQFLIRNSQTIENHWHVWPYADKLDPARCVTKPIQSDLESFCKNAVVANTPTSSEFFQEWATACLLATNSVNDHINLAGGTLSEPAVARLISQLAPEGSVLFLGNSMPIRDMDMFGVWPQERQLTVFANRGASGIDGLIASAAGVAQGKGTVATLVIGDLSALHDLNSLALLRQNDQPPLVVVVINNDGGGIFHFLPIANQRDHFERFFGTPHGMCFQEISKAFGLEYAAPTSPDDFESAYHEAIRSSTSTIIEVTTNRQDNLRLHRTIEESIQRSER